MCIYNLKKNEYIYLNRGQFIIFFNFNNIYLKHNDW